MNLYINLVRGIRLATTAYALVTIASLFSATASAADSNSAQPVTVYQHVNFRGNSLDIGEGEVSFRTLRQSSVGNDRISSIQIASGYEVYACQHSGFRGRCETFTSDTADLRTISFNDVVSSLRVSKIAVLPVTVFQHVNFRGNSLNIGEGEVSFRALRQSSVGNDRISSIRIASGYEVYACQHSGFRGRCETFTSDTADLRTISFNDVVSSLRVQQGSTGPEENNPPVAADLTLATNADTSISISVRDAASDSDEQDELVFGTVSDLTLLPGIFTDNGDGTYFYDPNGQFAQLPMGEIQTVSFEYTVSDGLASDTGTVNVEVEGTFIDPGMPTFALGDIGPGGGVVFYVINDGLNGFETTSANLQSSEWGCLNVDVLTGTEVGTGKANTDAIIAANCKSLAGNPSAADVAAGVGEGWFLPSRDELNLLYLQLELQELQDLATTFDFGYWSSSQAPSPTFDDSLPFGLSWIQFFTNGSTNNNGSGIDDKFNGFNVRAIRAF